MILVSYYFNEADLRANLNPHYYTDPSAVWPLEWPISPENLQVDKLFLLSYVFSSNYLWKLSLIMNVPSYLFWLSNEIFIGDDDDNYY